MTKTFEFTSFEQAQHFVQRVGRFASQKDHHPEWQTSGDGKVISARLTSHFAGNKVTLYDFQLAEEMNKAYKITQKEYSAYPWIKPKTAASFNVFVLTFFGSLILLNFGVYYNDITYVPAGARGNYEDLKRTPIVIPEYVLDVSSI